MTKAATRQVKSISKNVRDEDLALKRALLEALDQHGASWKRLPDDKAILVDRQGEPVAVVLTYQHFERLLNKLEDLQDIVRARAVLDAIRNGEEKTIPWTQVEAELRAEGILDE